MKGRSASDAIEGYFPRKIPDEIWQQVRAHVSEVVASSSPVNYDTAIHRMLAYTHLCAWALRVGRPLQVEDLLRPEVVEHYVATACADLSRCSAGTRRSVLRTLGRQSTRLAPWVDPPPAYPSTTPGSPYSAQECAWLLSCVPAQATQFRRRALGGLLGLCLGAGLNAPEAGATRAGDLVVSSTSPNHLSVQLPDREIPVRAQYAGILRDVIAPLAADTPILRDEPLLNAPRTIWNMIDAVEIPPQLRPLTTTRLRATWVFDALCAPIALPVVMAAHGRESTSFIERLLPALRSVELGEISNSSLHDF